MVYKYISIFWPWSWGIRTRLRSQSEVLLQPYALLRGLREGQELQARRLGRRPGRRGNGDLDHLDPFGDCFIPNGPQNNPHLSHITRQSTLRFTMFIFCRTHVHDPTLIWRRCGALKSWHWLAILENPRISPINLPILNWNSRPPWETGDPQLQVYRRGGRTACCNVLLVLVAS